MALSNRYTLCCNSNDGSTDALLPPPRLMGPLSTATVTSARPTFKWSLPGEIDGAHVEICQDRACATVLVAFDATGSTGRPPGNLDSGVLYWRAFGRRQSATGERASVVWQFNVGARSAPVDTSWGTTLDVNGDGYADVAVGAPAAMTSTGRAYVYLGSKSGLPSSPTTALTGPDGLNGNFGGSVASGGDLDGDGYADLIVAANINATGVGHVYVYPGGAAGVALHPSTILTANSMVSSVAGVGDVNGDGYGDIVVGSRGLSAYVYFGSASGLSPSPSMLTGPANSGFGLWVAGAGDVNGDGYADVIVGASGASQAYVYLGGGSGLQPSPLILGGPDGTSSGFGSAVASAGDSNGDGYSDVVVGASTANKAYIYFGAAKGLKALPNVTLVGPNAGAFGSSVACGGDVNGDGYSDVLVGAPTGAHAYVYLGSPSGPASSGAVSLLPSVPNPPSIASDFGSSVAGAGDIDGDGHSELIVGDFGSLGSNNFQFTGQAYLYFWKTSGPQVPVNVVAPDAAGRFGSSVASSVTQPTRAICPGKFMTLVRSQG